MARAKKTDFLHNFRFHVVVQSIDGVDILGTTGAKPSAGFNSVTTPEVSHDAVEYREGHFIYTQKYVGLPTVSDITLTRGVALLDGTFWKWMKDVIEGNAEYRTDLSIYHLHRDSKPETSTTPGSPNVKQDIPADKGFLEYKCGECFPIRHKVSSDLDATGSEVSIQEIDVAVEHFDIVDHGPI